MRKLAKTNDGEILREGMCGTLESIMEALENEVKELSEKVEQKSGIKINLKVERIGKISDEKWLVMISGLGWTEETNQIEFIIKWLKDTSPSHFHLFKKSPCNHEEHYLCMLRATGADIAKEMGIFTHHKQIPGVLSRW